MRRRRKRPFMFEKTKRQKKKTKAPENVPHFTNESSVMKHMLLQYTFFFLTTIHHPVRLNPTIPPQFCAQITQSPRRGRDLSSSRGGASAYVCKQPNAPGVVGITSQLKSQNATMCLLWLGNGEKKERKKKAPTKSGRHYPFLSARCVDRNLLNRKPHV